MDLSILFSLVLHIAFDDFLVGILSDRVHVKATRPEVSTPEEFFDLRMRIEDMFGCEAFGDLGYFGGCKDRNALNEEMDMVLVRSNLDEPEFIALLDFQTNLF